MIDSRPAAVRRSRYRLGVMGNGSRQAGQVHAGGQIGGDLPVDCVDPDEWAEVRPGELADPQLTRPVGGQRLTSASDGPFALFKASAGADEPLPPPMVRLVCAVAVLS